MITRVGLLHCFYLFSWQVEQLGQQISKVCAELNAMVAGTRRAEDKNYQKLEHLDGRHFSQPHERW